MATSLAKKTKQELEKKLLKDQKRIGNQIEELKQDDPFINPDHVTDNAAVDTDVREKVGHETIEAQINTLKRRLEAISYALEKIKSGGYGKCERCKTPINVARLNLLPECRYCVECEKRLVK